MTLLMEGLCRDSPVPAGPDPYKLVNDDLDFIKGSIKKTLQSKKGGSSASALGSNDVLTMAAREFMQRKGKSFRPMLVLLTGRATNPDFTTDIRHSKLAVIAEMIHTASLIHADVLEEHETDTTVGTLVHQEVALDVGNKVCILAGDFLLAKAAVELSFLESSAVTEIVARGLESICEGGMRGFDSEAKAGALDRTQDEHMAVIRQSISELVGNACHSSAILSGHESTSLIALGCKEFGDSLATARQLVTEADSVEAALRKSRRNPSSFSGAPSTPLLLAAQQYPELKTMLTGEATAASAAQAAELIERAGSIEATRRLAETYAQSAAESLAVLPNSATRDALLVLCHKVVTGTPIK